MVAARAADALTPQIIHVSELIGDALGPVMALPVASLRSKTFISAEGMTIAVQVGRCPSISTTTATSSSLSWREPDHGSSDKEVRVKPGDLVVIPKGTPHGGTKPDCGEFKSIAIKTPPQVAGDTKMLP